MRNYVPIPTTHSPSQGQGGDEGCQGCGPLVKVMKVVKLQQDLQGADGLARPEGESQAWARSASRTRTNLGTQMEKDNTGVNKHIALC